MFALLGVIAHPAMAVALSCACAKPDDAARACCHAEPAKQEAASELARACCSEHARGAQAERGDASQLESGCCCRAAPVATAPSRQLARLLDDGQQLIAPLDGVIAERDAFAASGVPLELGGLGIAAPPLQALYCIWLK